MWFWLKSTPTTQSESPPGEKGNVKVTTPINVEFPHSGTDSLGLLITTSDRLWAYTSVMSDTEPSRSPDRLPDPGGSPNVEVRDQTLGYTATGNFTDGLFVDRSFPVDVLQPKVEWKRPKASSEISQVQLNCNVVLNIQLWKLMKLVEFHALLVDLKKSLHLGPIGYF